MAWLAVNKNGTEKMFKHYPFKRDDKWMDWLNDYGHTTIEELNSFKSNAGITLPFNSILALTGQKITFEDEPIKI